MALRKVRYRREAFAEVNMTNLIDIVMVLLIMFILVSDFVSTGLKVKLSEVSYVVATGKEKIIVALDKAGKVSIGKDVVEWEALPGKLTALHEEFPEEAVFVRADQAAVVGDMMRIMSIATEVGFKSVDIPMKLKAKTSN